MIFCYRRFGDRPHDSLAISPTEFRAQMQALKDNGIAVIPMKEFLAWRRGEKNIPPRSCIITIDDREYGIPAPGDDVSGLAPHQSLLA
jgi:peptidoglycan/xylan/chitin deacetylase (PgdA/CDA1 family)